MLPLAISKIACKIFSLSFYISLPFGDSFMDKKKKEGGPYHFELGDPSKEDPLETAGIFVTFSLLHLVCTDHLYFL